MSKVVWGITISLYFTIFLTTATNEQFSNNISIPADHPALQYSTRETFDAVATLNKKLVANTDELEFEKGYGYLSSVLNKLEIHPDTQTLVFSETSFQSEQISPANPRALYFNDTVAVGWVPNSRTLEIAAQDPRQGVIFYSLEQNLEKKPTFQRNERCLQCHLTPFTGNVPGFLIMSMLPLSDNPNEYAQGWVVDHRTPITERWGGWYVTGLQTPTVHLGNVPVHHVEKSYVRTARAPIFKSLDNVLDTSPYLTPHSDVAALLVLNHQSQVINLLTRLGWEARVADYEKNSDWLLNTNTVTELVDYLLFIDETPLPTPVQGSSGFTKRFSATRPYDRKGRSLRQLDLQRRLLRYPCSYMIYSPAFDALPPETQNAIYQRMWTILSGQASDPVYARLALDDRQAIIEILRDTKPGLPDYFSDIHQ
tara:strand:- start:462 stop:1736 length:1275 start_codon:yes stop_codon:yes gene_type:complete